ncbi:hypothetical protein Dimus_004541 [Dionaea muscipula]
MKHDQEQFSYTSRLKERPNTRPTHKSHNPPPTTSSVVCWVVSPVVEEISNSWVPPTLCPTLLSHLDLHLVFPLLFFHSVLTFFLFTFLYQSQDCKTPGKGSFYWVD